ncbi:MAG: hypothetical protein SFY70_07875 [Bacteroidia bacterium]|nr:hypothetical protein [Bacteroidia bacterium]
MRVLLGVLVLAPQVLTAQKMTLEWAEEARTKGWQSIEPIGQVDDRLYFLMSRSKAGLLEYTLLSYTTQLTDPQQKPVYVVRTGSAAVGGQETPSVFFSARTKKLHFVGNTVNPTTKAVRTLLNSFSFEGESLVKNKEIASFTYESGRAGQAGSNIVASFDSSLIALYLTVPSKRKEAEQLIVQVFTQDFEAPVWDRTVELPYASKDASLNNAVVDKDGNFYLLYEIKEAAEARAQGAAKYYKTIFAVTPSGDPFEYVVKLEGQEIESVGIGTDPTGNLLVSGFYGPKGASRNSSGLFSFTLNVQTREPGQRFEKLIPDLYAADIGNRKKYEYRLRKGFILGDDGTQLLLAEQYYYYVVTTYYPYGGSNSTYHYVYGPAAIVKLSGGQEVEWVRRVPKLQHTTDDGGVFSSYYGFLYQDNVVLVYNDDPDNLTVLEDARHNDLDQSRRMKQAAVMAAIVAPDGTLQKQLLQAYDPTLGVAIVPRLSQPINDTTHLVVARWRKDYRIGRLVVTE